MKTKIFLLSFFLFSAILFSKAAIITVVSGDNLQTKINEAVAGDILIVGPGTYTGNAIINKKLTLFGPGYNRSSGGDAVINGYVWFQNGVSDGSYFSGFVVNEVLMCSNNVTVIRNKVTNSLYMGSDGTTPYNTTGNKILQNYLCTNNVPNDQDNRVYIGKSANATQTNYLFKNNIVMTKISFNHANASTGTFENNVCDPDGSNTLTGWENCMYTVNGGINGISFYNNIFKGGFPNLNAGNGGIFMTDLNTPLNFKRNIVDVLTNGISVPSDNLISTAELFGGYPVNLTGLNNADGRVILKPLSPAINYGRAAPYGNGDTPIDAGAFGGEQPYVLNGIPIGPYIYSMNVPPLAAANSVIPVTIKAKTNN